jgi:catechol 2,3-dioxygenase-like lactoylglutathione lyase family enzyme
MSSNPIEPLGLGEVVLRVGDLQRSISFYRDVLGFQLIRVLHEAIAFIRIADGIEGHTQIVGLFGSDWPSNREGKTWDGCSPRLSTLHQFAVEISLRRYESVLDYLTAQGLQSKYAAACLDRLAINLRIRPGRQYGRVRVLRHVDTRRVSRCGICRLIDLERGAGTALLVSRRGNARPKTQRNGDRCLRGILSRDRTKPSSTFQKPNSIMVELFIRAA